MIQGAAALGGGVLCGARFGSALADTGSARTYRFPDKFLWGACTSGLQHEGSPLADGAGPSALYQWAHEAARKKKVSPPGWFTAPVDTFDVSADFYNRYASDIQLMREMNLRAYSFEVYWPRILPEGTGKVNARGLEFYDRLVDALLEAGIAPLCNLYVFDHPAALQDRGGWLNRDMAQWFADYAAILFEHLGDRVPYWTPICEIPIVTVYTSGAIGPAAGESGRLRATHHLLLGQGLAAQAFRASGAKGQIGNQHNLVLSRPASSKAVDVAAAARANAYSTLLYLDSQLRGEYPSELIEWCGPKWPADAIQEGDLAKISTPIDFFGLNYGTTELIEHDASEQGGLFKTRSVPPRTSSAYETTARDVRDSLLWIRERYGKIPIYILEAGEAVEDEVVDGKVDDLARVAYFREYLTGLHRAIEDGVDLRGCFVWSFLDGWEFGYGLTTRYGLVHVDFATQKRTIKASGRWYGDVVAANGFTSMASRK